MTLAQFRTTVWKYHRAHGRHELSWRKTRDPYRILVSEVMLQQTQVERVLPYYERFLKKFPTVKTLAKAPLSEVLILWQGLGYNRRAKMLHEAAKEVVEKYGGAFPKTAEGLLALPGIGRYTAAAVAAFAYDAPVTCIETNIRTAVTHHFFSDRTDVDDKEILAILERALPKDRSREWHYALMDYGSYLKRSGVRINSKSKAYVKQSRFSGSNREARGAILKDLVKGPQTKSRLTGLLGDDRRTQLAAQLDKLIAEQLVVRDRSAFRLAD